jgi:peptidoglycan/xylan/chitin deacetylase (PgdA/CDA1 family)
MATNRYQEGVFCISLDFELHWGTFETVQLNEKGRKRFENTRKSIPVVLSLFEAFQIQATWASVGMLFNQNVSEWNASIPSSVPSYTNKQVSSYEWVNQHGFSGDQDPYHFAPHLVDLIATSPLMEVGTHTYSHFYCQESGQTVSDFKADLEMAIQKASLKNLPIRSLVFPRNQFNAAYLDVCKHLGITAVRSNPDIWFWDAYRPETLIKKIFRSADTLVPVDWDTSIPLSSLDVDTIPMQIPASRFLKPWHPNRLINAMKLERIKNEMTHAAKNNALYHLWWHPHNFGTNPDECIADLRMLLMHFKTLQSKYGMLSLHMDGIRNHLLEIQ